MHSVKWLTTCPSRGNFLRHWRTCSRACLGLRTARDIIPACGIRRPSLKSIRSVVFWVFGGRWGVVSWAMRIGPQAPGTRPTD